MSVVFEIAFFFLVYLNFSVFLLTIINDSKFEKNCIAKILFVCLLFTFLSKAFSFYLSKILISYLFLIITGLLLSFKIKTTISEILSKICVVFVFFLPLVFLGSIITSILLTLFGSFDVYFFAVPSFTLLLGLTRYCAKRISKPKLDMLTCSSLGQRIIFLAAFIAFLMILFSSKVRGANAVSYVWAFVVLLLLFVFYVVCVSIQSITSAEEIAKRDEEIEKSAAEIHDMKNAMMARAREAERLAGDLDVSPAEEMAAIQNPDDPEEERKIIFNSTGLLFFNSLLYSHARKARERGVTLDIKVLARATTLFLRYLPIWKFIHYAIGNLLENAVSSAAETEHPNPEVLFLFGCSPSGVYQVLVSDNGPDFEKEVLEHLGERGNTTKGSGHGNGFYSILKVVRLARASFVLREGPEKLYPYTKQICLIFDGAGRIEIQSRRAGNLRPKDPQIILTQTGEEAYV